MKRDRQMKRAVYLVSDRQVNLVSSTWKKRMKECFHSYTDEKFCRMWWCNSPNTQRLEVWIGKGTGTSTESHNTVARLQEIFCRSSYKDSATNRKKNRLFLDIFSSVKIIDFTMFLHSGSRYMPTVDISAVILDRGGGIFGHPMLDKCMSICALSLSYRCELRGSDIYLRTVRKKISNFFFRFSQRTCSWVVFA